MSMSQYQLPKWSRKPHYPNLNDGNSDDKEQQWTIEEIKSGVVVQTHVLDLPVITFGRIPLSIASSTLEQQQQQQQQQSHDVLFKSIVTAHESCSRLHARIAFDSSGQPWLRDLQSNNGTTINKKKIPLKSIGKYESTKLEEGSRGVMIYPGDVIQFGASTRIYVLDGPSYFDRGNVMARKQQQQQKQNLAVQGHVKQQQHDVNGKVASNDDDDDGVSWGMSFQDDSHDHDDGDDHDENHNTRTNLSTSISSSLTTTTTTTTSTNIPEKHLKLFNQIQSKKYKLSNIQTEIKRIQTKGMSTELTNGQQSQIERNMQRELGLLSEIEKLETELNHKLASSNLKSQQKQSDHNRRYDDDDDNDYDVDDFFDRTKKSTASKNINNDSTSTSINTRNEDNIETYESLITKWKVFLKKQKSHQQSVTQVRIKIQKIQTKLQVMDMETSNEDTFFLQNDLDIANDELKKKSKDIQCIEKELKSTERLILIANVKGGDNLVFDREEGFIGTQMDLDKIRKEKNQNMDNRNEMMMMPPPPPLPTQRPIHTNIDHHDSTKGNDRKTMPPPPSNRSINMNNSIDVNIMPPPLPIQPSQQQQQQPMAIPKNQKPTTTHKRKQPIGPIRPATSTSTTSSIGGVGAGLAAGGTLQAIQMASSSSVSLSLQSNNNNKNYSTNQNHANKKQKTSVIESSIHVSDIYNSRMDGWVKPKEQDGSGKTKLNAKFEGRY